MCLCSTTTASALPPVSFSPYVLPDPITNLDLRSGTKDLIANSSAVADEEPSHN